MPFSLPDGAEAESPRAMEAKVNGAGLSRAIEHPLGKLKLISLQGFQTAERIGYIATKFFNTLNFRAWRQLPDVRNRLAAPREASLGLSAPVATMEEG
jgi:hypothetical protein